MAKLDVGCLIWIAFPFILCWHHGGGKESFQTFTSVSLSVHSAAVLKKKLLRNCSLCPLRVRQQLKLTWIAKKLENSISNQSYWRITEFVVCPYFRSYKLWYALTLEVIEQTSNKHRELFKYIPSCFKELHQVRWLTAVTCLWVVNLYSSISLQRIQNFRN